MASFSDIVKYQRSQGAGVMGSLATAIGQSTLQKIDPRNYLFSRTGMSTSLFPFLKGYQAKSTQAKTVAPKLQPIVTQSFDKETVSRIQRIDVSSRINAKNSMVLPMMARDMNLMRQNIQKMTKQSTGSSVRKADMFFKRAPERESAYKSAEKKEGGSLIGGLLGGIGSAAGGLLGGAGSILGGAFRGIGGIMGSLFSLPSLGIFGLIAGIVSFSLLKDIISKTNFSDIGKSISEVFESILKDVKKVLGISDDKNESGGIFKKIAEKLDDTFETDFFSTQLTKISRKIEDFWDQLNFTMQNLYRDAKIVALSGLLTLKDVFVAVGKDISAIATKFFDRNTADIYAAVAGATAFALTPGGLQAKLLAGTAAAVVGKGVGELARLSTETEAGANLSEEEYNKQRKDRIARIENYKERIRKLTEIGPTARENITNLTAEDLQKKMEDERRILEMRAQYREARDTTNLERLLSGGVTGLGTIGGRYESHAEELQRSIAKPERIDRTAERAAEDETRRLEVERRRAERGQPTRTPSSTAATPTTPTKVSGNKEEFYKNVYAAVFKSATDQGVENPDVIARLGATQASLETGWGSAVVGNNFFGIKAKKGEQGVTAATKENIDGKEVPITATFRKYNSLQESADDYVKFLKENSRYSEVLKAKTVEQAIELQGKTGYATDPTYGNKLSSIYSGTRNLELPKNLAAAPSQDATQKTGLLDSLLSVTQKTFESDITEAMSQIAVLSAMTGQSFGEIGDKITAGFQALIPAMEKQSVSYGLQVASPVNGTELKDYFGNTV